MPEEQNSNIRDFLEIYYWPTLHILYVAIEKHDEAIKNKKQLKDNDPIKIELHRARKEWLKQLYGLEFIQKMCENIK